MSYREDLIEAAARRLEHFRRTLAPIKLSSSIKKLSVESLEWLINELENALVEVESLYNFNVPVNKFMKVDKFEIRVKERKFIAHWEVLNIPDVRLKIDPPEEFLDSLNEQVISYQFIDIV